MTAEAVPEKNNQLTATKHRDHRYTVREEERGHRGGSSRDDVPSFSSPTGLAALALAAEPASSAAAAVIVAFLSGVVVGKDATADQ